MAAFRVRALMWGALLVWIGIMRVVDENAGVASIGAGAILLIGALLRRAMGQHAGFILTVAGALLVLIGLNDLNGDQPRIPLFAVALIGFGAFVIARALSAGRGGTTIEIRRMHSYGGRRPPDDEI
ncbi:MAG TPA: hypothetical protein VGB52_02925 [Actinomycetota bacterium]